MPRSVTCRFLPSFIAALAALCVIGAPMRAAGAAEKAPSPLRRGCSGDDSGLTLPAGFCATVFADGIGHARHLVVAENGVVYANTWSGRYYSNDTPHAGGFLVALKDSNGSGKADVIERFGETVQSGGAGGTGIDLHQGWLYAEINDKIVRYRLPADAVVPADAPETVVSGLPLSGDHPMHPFKIDADGQMYIDVASATNSCQVKSRSLKSPGLDPCTELETRGGVWRYDANKTGQAFSPAGRFATGIRNAEGFALDPPGKHLFVSQHGRDQLHSNWPDIFRADQEATLPAEEVLLLKQGADYGWPECYYDPGRHQLMLAPEYGGDGKTAGVCAQKTAPVAVFPAHWAPNAMAFYDKPQFPAHYRNGLFIAFHGSWNRAPYVQNGYNVVFQGLAGDKASGRCEIFADGFAGEIKSPGSAAHRPSGLAVGPDGSLFVADDVRGRVYRISYGGGATGDRAARAVPCPSASAPAGKIAAVADKPPEGTDPDGGSAAAALPVPAGATQAMVLLGERIYHGQVGGATCTGCHGANGAGTPLGPDLTDAQWLWSDGSFTAIAATITQGVAQPKQFRAAMPAFGGAQLTHEQVTAVAAYVWAIAHNGR